MQKRGKLKGELRIYISCSKEIEKPQKPQIITSLILDATLAATWVGGVEAAGPERELFYRIISVQGTKSYQSNSSISHHHPFPFIWPVNKLIKQKKNNLSREPGLAVEISTRNTLVTAYQ